VTITVSGQTYNYREALKGMGGKFDGSTKTWSFPDSLSPRDINYIKQMVGVYVSKSTQPETPEQTFDRINERLGGAAIVRRENFTDFFGDDDEYFNYFAQSDPAAFFGFSNLEQCIKYIEQIPSEVHRDRRRYDGWKTDAKHIEFSKTRDMNHAIDLARNGWQDGNNKAAEVMEIIGGSNALQRKREYDVVGGRVNVGRLLTGNPLNMQRRTKQPGKKAITLFVETGMQAMISAETAILRAACIAAIVDLLDTLGYSASIVAIGYTQKLDNDNRSLYQTTIKIKNAGEPLNMNDTIFALGHPSMNRRFRFALCASSERCKDNWYSMGASVKPAFTEDHPTRPGEFYIPRVSTAIQSQIHGETLRERALSLLPHIIPEGLPIEVKS